METIIINVNRAVIINKDRALIIRNRGNDFWSLPGGKLDLGETLRDGLKREINEELHLALKALYLIGTQSTKKGNRVYHEFYWESIIDDHEAATIQPDIGPQGELEEIAWVDETEIDTMGAVIHPLELIKQAIIRNKAKPSRE